MMLAEIFNKHGCDKTQRHNYHKIYEPYFKKLKDKKINILEIGVFRGAGMSALIEYFPKATVYGIDIFTRVDTDEVQVLQHPRARWMKGDSTKETNLFDGVEFDLIIDDGYHTPEANKLSFRNTWPQLKEGGLYFIEDVWAMDRMTEAEKKHKWLLSKPKEFTMEHLNAFYEEISVGKVHHHDNRIMNQPDSYIIRVEK